LEIAHLHVAMAGGIDLGFHGHLTAFVLDHDTTSSALLENRCLPVLNAD
jgi:hypothetical protein